MSEILVTRSCLSEPNGFYTDYLSRLGQASVTDNLPYSERFSGLLLSGGVDVEPRRFGETQHPSVTTDPIRDAYELDIIAEFLRHGKPVFGICRGIQIINVYFGGGLIQDIPSQVKPESPVKHADNGFTYHEVAATDTHMRACFPAKRFLVNSSHHQAVGRLGQGILAAAIADDGVTEAICHEKLPVWGVQWHPERYDCGDGPIKEFLRYARG